MADDAVSTPSPPLLLCSSDVPQELLRIIVAEGPDAILCINAERRIVLFNLGATHMFGLSAEQVLGQPLQIILPFELSDLDIVGTGSFPFSRSTVCLQGKRRDGALFPCEATILRTELQQHTYFILDLRDISVRQAAQQELQASRDTLESEVRIRTSQLQALNQKYLQILQQQHAILNNIPDLAWLKDAQSRFIAVNKPFADICGQTPESITGKTDFDVWPKELAERYRRDDAAVMQQRQVRRVEEPLQDAQGRRIWIETIKAPILDDQQQVIGTTGIARDITERKASQAVLLAARDELEALVQARTGELELANQELQAQVKKSAQHELAQRASESRSRAILEALPDSMFLINRNGTLLDIRAADDQLPWLRTEALGKSISQLLPAEVAQRIFAAVRESLISGKPQVVEYQLAMPGGAQYFETRLVLIGPDEVLALVRNVTERIKLEQMKSDFIHRAAHELRTPLATISLMADLIQEGGSEAELAQYWQALRAELQRQRSLMEDLLTMGRVESGHFAVTLVPVSPAEVLQQALRAMEQIAAARRIRIETGDWGDLPPVLGDTQSLVQVFVNLLDNAVKFSAEDSTIRILCQCAEHTVTIQVSDQGIGIPAADLPTLFNRFVRASNAALNEIPGSGVGLYLVKVMLEKMHASIEVESTLGHGSTFSVQLQRSRV